MNTAVINREQMTLNFDAGLSERYASLKDCVATGVYQRGLKRVAIDLDMAPSNLSVQLSENEARHFSIDHLEAYLAKTGDMTPIYYLAEKFLSDKSAKKDAALADALAALKALQPLLNRAGLA